MACRTWRSLQNHGLRNSVKCKSGKKPQTLQKPIMKITWELLTWGEGIVKAHSVNLEHECALFISRQKRGQNSISASVSKNTNSNKKGRKPDEKLISSCGNEFFQGKRGSGEVRQGQCQQQFRAFPVELEGWDVSLRGSTWVTPLKKTQCRALSSRRLSLVMDTNIFPNRMLGHH